ncbi:MAG: DUF4159 domain-containing protein [Planctomycetaceae bacterium]|nr:DUF4159 domain-containing protein [Planctomycetaceae bacterium]MCP4462808.1 DUF4159 domain-containing protein [Planctomycetaceae bacterium]MDG1808080.1 DUF4159 domain-containing protein [Pirellulaceae bacterium]MDG2102143.1 DUF4159 domain-containing protein [Pirellulaceae bacterium]
MLSRKTILVVLLLLTTSAGGLLAFQEWGNRRSYRFRSGRAPRMNMAPLWTENKDFKNDVFTFARVKYTSAGQQWGQPQWSVDYPESDRNLSLRLKELTSLEVNPVPTIVSFSDSSIFNYPFVYLIEPGLMRLQVAEVEGFRQYIERGGFVMVDDFWGEREWQVFESEMKRVFPNREIVDLPLEHPIFNLIYQVKEKPQIPSIGHFNMGYTSDRWDAPHANYRAILDDDGRVVVMICHNTDLGDGWEREGQSLEYFNLYSEKFAYPLGINIVMYALTN